MKRTLTAGIAALALTLTACGVDDEDAPTTTVETTTTEAITTLTPANTEEVATTTAETPPPADVIPETVQQQIDEAATEGRGPRPALDEMTLVDGFGYVGIYTPSDGMDYYVCDARGTPTLDIMGDDGCSAPMGWSEAQEAFGDSLLRSVETQ